jgi:CRISPR-associated endonuclease/helicase Cas3
MYQRFLAGDFPASCSLPTGLGKTSIIHIWLLALARAPHTVPRRLVYVVNRRTVVDQSTDEVRKVRARIGQMPELLERLRQLCAAPRGGGIPLAISTLRGQLADNREWSADPARPAIIVGTVDMIGSRLLFSGYACGFKSRPLHAGLLGQDVLLVHDEAHLEPAFQGLLTAIGTEQRRCREFRPLRVMELTAMAHGGQDQFRLTTADGDAEEVRRRIRATKRLTLHPVADQRKTAERVVDLALQHAGSGQAVLVLLSKLDDVARVADRLGKKYPAGRLTGTLRGYERDRLCSENEIFRRLLPRHEREGRTVIEGTVYLVCTSAGEVGVNISADHLVCDLIPFDSMVQRFGRVNRFGDGDSRIDVVYPKEIALEDEYERRRARTLDLLRVLEGDASPAALAELQQCPDLHVAVEESFAPAPLILPTTEILFDAWALTTVRDPLPGRPPVADWIHGVSERDLPETRVAWREEVGLLTPANDSAVARERLEKALTDLFDEYPLKPHEILRDTTPRVQDHLVALALGRERLPAWVIDTDNTVRVLTLGDLASREQHGGRAVYAEKLASRTVVLPPAAGGLTASGTLSGEEAQTPELNYDVADNFPHSDERPRMRFLGVAREDGWDWNLLGSGPVSEVRPDSQGVVDGMQLVAELEIAPTGSEGSEDDGASQEKVVFLTRIRAGDGSGSAGQKKCELDPHLDAAGQSAERFVDTLRLGEPVRSAVVFATRHHDRGKRRDRWQRAIGNVAYPKEVWAKSEHSRSPEDVIAYRHEFGSLLDVSDLSKTPEFAALAEEARELVLHLIAAHHGRARPHFPPDERYDPERPEDEAERMAGQVPQRFERLQRRYGRWGLAYLESLVRAADILGSHQPREENR